MKRNRSLIILILILTFQLKATAWSNCTGPVVRVACPGNLWKINLLLGKKQYLDEGLMESSLSEYITASETQGSECQCEPLLKIADALLKEGADPNYQSKVPAYKGESPLILIFRNEEIANNDKINWIKLLHSYGADLNARTGERNKRIPLLLLNVRAGRDDVVQYLLKNGANPDLTDDYGRTALFMAAQYNNTDVLKMLLEKGADKGISTKDITIEGTTVYGKSPLMEAVDKGNYEAAELLLAYGADVAKKSNDGRDALKRAIDNIKYMKNAGPLRVRNYERKLKRLTQTAMLLLVYSAYSKSEISSEDLKILTDAFGVNPDGVKVAKNDGKYALKNGTAKDILHGNLDMATPFSGGLSLVMKDGKWLYIDDKGKVAITLEKGVTGMPFSNDTAIVVKNRKFGAIDKKGKLIIPFNADIIHWFENGVALFRRDSKTGYLGDRGNLIADAVYDDIPLKISEELIVVMKDKKAGFLDKKGALAIPLKYDAVKSFRDGLARFKSNGRWGYVDLKGVEVVTAKYNDAMDFSEGLAPVKLKKLWGFIDKNGKLVIDNKFKGIYRGFKNGTAKMNLCEEDDCWAVIDKAGKIIEKVPVDSE